MSKLVHEGKIPNIGISNFSAYQIELVIKYFDIYACQANYSILHRQVESNTLQLCKDKGIKFYAYQPLESGLLTGKFFPVGNRILANSDWRNRSPLFSNKSLDYFTDLNVVLNSIATRNLVTVASISLAWVTKNSNCDVALFGVRDLSQLLIVRDSMKVNLTARDRFLIDQSIQGFLSHD